MRAALNREPPAHVPEAVEHVRRHFPIERFAADLVRRLSACSRFDVTGRSTSVARSAAVLRRNVARLFGLLDGVGRDPRRLAINVTHSIYYRSVIQNTWYHGIQILKSPLDLWIYQEILAEHPVDLLIETGTHNGGSALYLAHVMDRLNRGRIVSIDVLERERPKHNRIEYLLGSSTSQTIVREVASRCSRTTRDGRP